MTREQKAVEVSRTPGALRKRLTDARTALSADMRPLFKDAVFDFPGKRLVTRDGRYALVWRLRARPEEPEDYDNQQTSRGFVELVELLS